MFVRSGCRKKKLFLSGSALACAFRATPVSAFNYGNTGGDVCESTLGTLGNICDFGLDFEWKLQGCVDLKFYRKCVDECIVCVNYGICDDKLVGSTLGGLSKRAKDLGSLCPCLKHLEAFAETGGSTADAYIATGELLNCFQEEASSITSGRDKKIEEVKQEAGVEIFGPEIGLKYYIAFLGAIAGCAFGDCASIAEILLDLFLAIVGSMRDGLVYVIENEIKEKISSPFESLFVGFENLLKKEARIEEACQDVTDSIDELKLKYWETRAALENKYDELKSDIEEMKTDFDNVAKALKEVPNSKDAALKYVGKKLLECPGSKNPLDCLLGPVKVLVEGLGSTINKSTTFVVKVKSCLNELEQDATELKSSVEKLRDAGCNSDGLNVADYIDIQKLFEDAANTFKNEIKIWDIPELEFGWVTYSSEWKIVFDLPCTKAGYIDIEGIGFDYPEIYSCDYNRTITLPNEHVPYIRLIFDEDIIYDSADPVLGLSTSLDKAPDDVAPPTAGCLNLPGQSVNEQCRWIPSRPLEELIDDPAKTSGHVLAYSVTPEPPFQAIDDATLHEITLTVTDFFGRSASCESTLILVNQPPKAICDDLQVRVNAQCTWSPSALSDVPLENLINNGSSDHEGSVSLSVHPSRDIFSGVSGFDSETDIGFAYRMTLTATDRCNKESKCAADLILLNDAPHAVCTSISREVNDPTCAWVPENLLVDIGNDSFDLEGGAFKAGGAIDLSTDLSGPFLGARVVKEHHVTLTAKDRCLKEDSCVATVTVTNAPPVTICKDIQEQVDEECKWVPSSPLADLVNNGSYDPEGFDIILAASPVGPFSGLITMEHDITLRSEDVCGADSDCVSKLTLIDLIPPVGFCTPSFNPAGNIPGNGNGNGNGKNNIQGNGKSNNPGGFFTLRGDDNCKRYEVYVVDNGSGTEWGPFEDGANFKYTQAPGAPPSIDVGPGEVDWMIKGNGEAYIKVVDDSGNVSIPGAVGGAAWCVVAPHRQLRGDVDGINVLL